MSHTRKKLVSSHREIFFDIFFYFNRKIIQKQLDQNYADKGTRNREQKFSAGLVSGA